MIGSFLLLHCLAPFLFAEEKIGLGELDRLIKIHKPKKPVEGFDATVGAKKSVQLLVKGEPTVFFIPGFKAFGCSGCHQANDLLDLSANRMRQTLQRLNRGDKLSNDTGGVTIPIENPKRKPVSSK